MLIVEFVSDLSDRMVCVIVKVVKSPVDFLGPLVSSRGERHISDQS